MWCGKTNPANNCDADVLSFWRQEGILGGCLRMVPRSWASSGLSRYLYFCSSDVSASTAVNNICSSASMAICCSIHLLGISSCNHPWHGFQCTGMDWNALHQALFQHVFSLIVWGLTSAKLPRSKRSPKLSCYYLLTGDVPSSGTRASTSTSGQLSGSSCSASSRWASRTSHTTLSRRSTWWRDRLATSSLPTTTPWTSGTSTRSTASSGTSPSTPGRTLSGQARCTCYDCLQMLVYGTSVSTEMKSSSSIA